MHVFLELHKMIECSSDKKARTTSSGELVTVHIYFRCYSVSLRNTHCCLVIKFGKAFKCSIMAVGAFYKFRVTVGICEILVATSTFKVLAETDVCCR